jgi:hypothetical protein
VSGLNVTIPEETAEDKLATLDRELNDSLAAFDEMLLQELEFIRTRSAAKMRDFAIEAADAAKRLKESGETVGSESEWETEPSERQGDDSHASNGGSKRTGKGPGRKDTSTSISAGGHGYDRGGPGKKGGTSPIDERQAHPEEQDDDIVARQLREAAENEKDPELRAKLWEKYREYKNSTSD